uniref:hypothetical protein n=1 Tax=Pseudomonas amygdali TaxID=47877 RepID=UPI001C823415
IGESLGEGLATTPLPSNRCGAPARNASTTQQDQVRPTMLEKTLGSLEGRVIVIPPVLLD